MKIINTNGAHAYTQIYNTGFVMSSDTELPISVLPRDKTDLHSIMQNSL
jgi:hypothetical protein